MVSIYFQRHQLQSENMLLDVTVHYVTVLCHSNIGGGITRHPVHRNQDIVKSFLIHISNTVIRKKRSQAELELLFPSCLFDVVLLSPPLPVISTASFIDKVFSSFSLSSFLSCDPSLLPSSSTRLLEPSPTPFFSDP